MKEKLKFRSDRRVHENEMGAKSSTPRTVHLENDTPIGVIDVSDDVVQRLKGMNAQGLWQ